MKKITNVAAPTIITTRRTPLTISFSIEQVDGQPLTQAMDSTTGRWLPDRTEFPLILEPVFVAVNEDTGQFVTPTSVSYKWYIDKGMSTESEITSYSESDDFYLERDEDNNLTGGLVVRKNVYYIKTAQNHGPVTLTCEATYSDDSSATTNKESASVLLTSANRPEDFYALSIDCPSPINYKPLSNTQLTGTVKPFVTANSTVMDLKATVMKGKDIVSDTDDLNALKFFWYVDDVLIAGTEAFYVSGVNSQTIQLDADYMDSCTIKVRMANDTTATEPNIQATAVCNLQWIFPRIEALPYCKEGSAVKDSSGYKDFGSIVTADGTDMDDADVSEYLRLEWYSKSTTNTTKTARGWGREIIIPKAALLLGSSQNVEVGISVYQMGKKEVVTVGGEAVTINSESITTRT